MIPPASPASISDSRREGAGTNADIQFYPGDQVEAQPFNFRVGGGASTSPPVRGEVVRVWVFGQSRGSIEYTVSVAATPTTEAYEITSRAHLMKYLWSGELRRYIENGIVPNFYSQYLEERRFYIRHGLVTEVDSYEDTWTPWTIMRALRAGKIDTFRVSWFGKDFRKDFLNAERLVGLKLDNEQAGERVRRATLRVYRFWWWRLLINGAYWYKSPMNPW